MSSYVLEGHTYPASASVVITRRRAHYSYLLKVALPYLRSCSPACLLLAETVEVQIS